MNQVYLRRRVVALFLVLLTVVLVDGISQERYDPVTPAQTTDTPYATGSALKILKELPVKGRAQKTGYSRDLFGDGWLVQSGCDTRNRILQRDLTSTIVNSSCQVVSGILADPYTAKRIEFTRGETGSQAVQIDHVVALSDAWQKGAQQMPPETRVQFANDPLELLAVDGDANQQKGDGDAATWLPPNKSFRCQYVSRQIAVKKKYGIWITPSEKQAMLRVLASCPAQEIPRGSM